jgi:gamma-glutamyltranspeptidase/glutathione hydrolase
MQVVMNMVDFGMNPQAALDAPRWFWQKGFTVRMESAWPQAVVESLRARGHDIQTDSGFYGRGNIIVRLEDGTLCGGAEPRDNGSVMGY